MDKKTHSMKNDKNFLQTLVNIAEFVVANDSDFAELVLGEVDGIRMKAKIIFEFEEVGGDGSNR